MSNFVLIPRISPSEQEFRKTISQQDWDSLKRDKIWGVTNQCQGCGYSTVNSKDCLDLHLVFWDVEDISKNEYVVLCRACHTIQHMDMAIEKNMVKIVNSCHSQVELIRWGRASKNDLQREIDVNNIMFLKKDIFEYLDELKNNTLPINNKIKAFLSDTFNWKDCI